MQPSGTEPLLDLQAAEIRQQLMAEAAGPAPPPGDHNDETDIEPEGIRGDPLQKAADELQESMAQLGPSSASRSADQPAGDAFPILGGRNAAGATLPPLSTTALMLPTPPDSWARLEPAYTAQTMTGAPVSTLALALFPMAPVSWPALEPAAGPPTPSGAYSHGRLVTSGLPGRLLGPTMLYPPVPPVTTGLAAVTQPALTAGHDAIDDAMASFDDLGFMVSH